MESAAGSEGQQEVEAEDVAVKLYQEAKMDGSTMEKHLNQQQMILRKTAGSVSCCIFKIPPSVFTVNKGAFYPQIVSIGPLHHGRKHLQMIQEHKGRFLNNFLHRTSPSVSVASLCKMIEAMELQIRDSYAESLHFSSQDLVEIMLLDGVFILELLLKMRKLTPVDSDDPIFKMTWIFPFITRDLLRLENQIPFFILESIYDIFSSSSAYKVPPLHQLALELFDYAFQRPRKVLENQIDMEWKHLLDLFRLSFLPRKRFSRKKKKHVTGPRQLIPSVKKLRGAGIKIMAVPCTESFLDVKFDHGVLEIPVVAIDDFISCVFLNCIAFEQCYSNSTTHITNYTAFMGCLITTPGDAEFLCERNVVENYLGTNEDIADFFHVVNKDVVVDLEGSFLGDLFMEVNLYCSRRRSVIWKMITIFDFNNPLSAVCILAASLILILTAVQTFFTVYSYWYPPHA